ncbi:MAG: phosphotransferase [Defluviitaleaceae bacterium]|nr:phosphotransferase [Defluviitaleaceae bacterium]MCL2273286.1 phosphotransferase [Defluviitaleaceae bacterium]
MVSENLLVFASKNYGFDKSTLNFVSDSTNQIYTFQKNGKHYFLRFSNRPAEKISETEAEMEWLYYLAKNNVNVALPLTSEDGSLVISTQDDRGHYIITSFEALVGEFWDKNNPVKWNEKIFYNWGKVMGCIHSLTKNFNPSSTNVVRSTFCGRFALDDSVKSCPSVNAIAEDLIKEMMALPKDKDFYGLIHNDMHQWNFLVDSDKINVFDFDDSLYGWFALDIGIALYHALWWGRKDDAGNDFTDSIILNFIKGYLSVNDLSDFWLAKIPMFMKFRQICKFSWFFDANNIGEHQRERINNIENDVLFSDCEIKAAFFKRPK